MVMGITADVKKLHNGKKARRESFEKKAGAQVSKKEKKGREKEYMCVENAKLHIFIKFTVNRITEIISV